MAQTKPYATYRGDFRTAIRQYSFDRMDRDPQYRREVRKAVSARRAARKATQGARNATPAA
jgi:hypothetical protein